MSTQATVNYTDDAQRRVCADTLAYQKKATITVDTTGQVELDPEVIKIEGIYEDSTQIEMGSTDELLMFLSGGQELTGASRAAFVGRTLYLFPLPSEDLVLTLIYRARAPSWESDDQLTLTGQYETLVEQLATATMTLDGGQTNVAAASLAEYETQAARLRRKAGAKPGGSGRLRRLGQRV